MVIVVIGVVIGGCGSVWDSWGVVGGLRDGIGREAGDWG